MIKFKHSQIRNIQLTLNLFVAVSALFGGIGLIFTNGLGMSVEILKPSPFNSFVIPGLILSGIVGGTHILAFYLLLQRKDNAQFYAAVASFGLLIWLFTEVFWLLHTSPLQPIYFAIGIIELMCVLGILNVAPWLLVQKNK